MGIGAAVAGAGVLGAGASLFGSSEQAGAAQKSANEQLQMYQQTQGNLAPYNALGQTAAQGALSLAQGSPTGGGPNYLTQAAANMPPSMMTEAAVQQTPGYQFNLAQGLKATQSAAAARGLGVSGASMKGAATYATGLADSTYQNQFNNAQQVFSNYLNLNTGQQTNLSNQFSRLSNLGSLGENAAATSGQQGTYAASNYGNYNTQAGTALGSGTMNASNAVSGSVNNMLAYNYAQQNSPAAIAQAIAAAQQAGTSGFGPAYQAGAFAALPSGTYGPNQ